MIKLAYILPHSPILIPSIGKKNISILNRTIESFQEVQEKLIEEKIDTILIISPHKKEDDSEISINTHFDLRLNFQDFGDYSSKLRLENDMDLAYQIKEFAEEDFYVNLKAENHPDYGVSIPLYCLLSKNNQKIKEFKGKIVHISSTRSKDLRYHYEFAKKINKFLESTEKRILIIASAELSHCLINSAPGGFFHKASLFDEKTIENIKKGPSGFENIINSDEKLALEAKECGLRPISLMLGLISHLEVKPKTMSYQKDLGVGYLSMDMGI